MFPADWEEFVSLETLAWRDMALQWIPTIRQGGILHYENLIRDRPAQFRKLVNLLGVGQLDEKRLKCTLKHDFRAFKRNSTKSK